MKFPISGSVLSAPMKFVISGSAMSKAVRCCHVMSMLPILSLRKGSEFYQQCRSRLSPISWTNLFVRGLRRPSQSLLSMFCARVRGWSLHLLLFLSKKNSNLPILKYNLWVRGSDSVHTPLHHAPLQGTSGTMVAGQCLGSLSCIRRKSERF